MELQIIHEKIFEVRGQKVMLDFDLAELYEVETKRLKEAVRRNMERFPSDFMFELTREEYNFLRTQFATLEIAADARGKYSKYNPFAFTEQGVAMLSTALKSDKAIKTSIAIMRAFVVLRRYALTYSELAEKIEELESRYDEQFDDVNEALDLLLADRESQADWENRERIGFKK